jgi:predicted O-methyltransferase YrrM
MLQIKELLHSYLERNIGVHYYGWVSKKELAEAWKTSQYWLYPCTFMETFCLTALEAAKSKTLAITNNLAALKNTVGNRGIIIEGDPTTKEWQDKTLMRIKQLLIIDTNKDDYFYKQHIENNYNWALNLSWNNQANKLLNKYILTNKFEYKGMYNWTNDCPEGSKEIFLKTIEYFNINHIGKDTKILEIGTYTGISLINIVKLIPNSIGYGIDKWSNYVEVDANQNVEILNNMDELEVESSFYKNVALEGLTDRISGIKGDSYEVLFEMMKECKMFDFIYIDGSHLSFDCYSDLMISWRLLARGGLLAIDDYLYNTEGAVVNSPFEGVNHFLKKHQHEVNILHKGYRVFLIKV